MDPAEYGIVQSMQILVTVFTIFFTLATERSIFRIYYDYKTEKQQKTFIGNVFLVILAVSSILLFLLFLFSEPVGKIYSSISFYPYYAYTIINTYFLAFSYTPGILFQVKQQALRFISLSLMSFFIGILFIIYFLMIKEEGATGMLKGQMIGNGIMFLVYVPITLKNSVLKIDKKIIRNICSFSIPMIPSLLSSWIIVMSNRIFLERYLTLFDVGIYSMAFKIASASTVVLGAFLTAYNPIFYKYANATNQLVAKEDLRNLNYIFSILSLYLCFVISFLSKEIVLLFLNNQYLDTYKYIPIIVLSAFLTQISGVFNLMVYQNKKTIFIMVIMIFCAFMSIILNIVLIPMFGIMGASLVGVLSALFYLIFVCIVAKKNYYISFSYKKIIIFFLVFTALYLFGQMISLPPVVSLVLKILFVGIIGIIFGWKYKNKLILLRK